MTRYTLLITKLILFLLRSFQLSRSNRHYTLTNRQKTAAKDLLNGLKVAGLTMQELEIEEDGDGNGQDNDMGEDRDEREVAAEDGELADAETDELLGPDSATLLNDDAPQLYDQIHNLLLACFQNKHSEVAGSVDPVILFVVLQCFDGRAFKPTGSIAGIFATLQYWIRATIFYEMVRVHTQQEKPLVVACDELIAWIKADNSETLFTWQFNAHWTAAKENKSTSGRPRFWMDEDVDPDEVHFDGRSFKISRFHIMVQYSLDKLETGLRDLLADLDLSQEELEQLDRLTGHMVDRLATTTCGYSFLDDTANNIKTLSDIFLRKVINSNEYHHVDDAGRWHWIPKKCDNFLQKCQWFVRQLAVTMHLTFGQLPRGSELMSTLFRNTGTRQRNLTIIGKRFVTIGEYSKNSSNTGREPPIPRASPEYLTPLLTYYLALIRPLESLLTKEYLTDSDNQPLPDAHLTDSHLFYTTGIMLNTSDLTDELRFLTEKFLGTPYNTADIRQIVIFLGRESVLGHARVRQLGEIFDLMSGHSSQVANINYGVSSNSVDRMSLAELKAYLTICDVHHEVYGVKNRRVTPFQLHHPQQYLTPNAEEDDLEEEDESSVIMGGPGAADDEENSAIGFGVASTATSTVGLDADEEIPLENEGIDEDEELPAELPADVLGIAHLEDDNQMDNAIDR